MPMNGLKLPISDVGSNRFTSWATTAAKSGSCLAVAQLSEWSLPILKDSGSNPVVRNF